MMSRDSSPPPGQRPALPPARARVRSPRSARETPPSDAAGDPVAPVPPLIGEGPRQYLLGCEDHKSFDRLRAAIDDDLQPTGPIERMWVDEIVDLEWDLHRLRRMRRTVVETALIERLAYRTHTIACATAISSRATRLPAPAPGPAREASDEDPFDEDEADWIDDSEAPLLDEVRYQARQCVRGDRHGRDYLLRWLIRLNMDDELLAAQADCIPVLGRLETSIQATSRLRDAVVNRLYSRRDFMERRRVDAGDAQ